MNPFQVGGPQRRLFFTALAILAASALPAADVSKPIQLLPAKSLDSFYVFTRTNGLKQDPNKVYTLENGVLHVNAIGGEAYLATKAEYSQYRLVAEYKWGPASERGERDSGIFVHGYGQDKWFMSSIECNLMSHPQWYSGAVLMFGSRCHMSVNGEPVKKTSVPAVNGKNHEKPVGEWNTMEILSDSGRFQVKVNGIIVTEGTDATPLAGKILIQSKRGEIFFRRVELQPVR